MSSSSVLARRYAKALLGLGLENGGIDHLGVELREVAQAFGGSSELRAVVKNPAVPSDAKRRVLAAVLQKMKASQTVSNFVGVLLDKKRMDLFGDIQVAYDELAQEQSGKASATVHTAAPMSDAFRKSLRERLSAISGKTVELTEVVDDTLLGGVVATMGGTVYDASLRTQINRLKKMGSNQ